MKSSIFMLFLNFFLPAALLSNQRDFESQRIYLFLPFMAIMYPSLWVQDIFWGCIVFWKDIETLHLRQVFFKYWEKLPPIWVFGQKLAWVFARRANFEFFWHLSFRKNVEKKAWCKCYFNIIAPFICYVKLN